MEPRLVQSELSGRLANSQKNSVRAASPKVRQVKAFIVKRKDVEFEAPQSRRESTPTSCTLIFPCMHPTPKNVKLKKKNNTPQGLNRLLPSGSDGQPTFPDPPRSDTVLLRWGVRGRRGAGLILYAQRWQTHSRPPVTTETPPKYMWLEESGFSVPGTPFLYRSERPPIRLQPPQPREYPPSKKERASAAQGVQTPGARLGKGSGAPAGPPSPALAPVASRKHTLPPGPLLGGGPMTHSQAGLAGERCCLKGDSTEKQRVVTRT